MYLFSILTIINNIVLSLGVILSLQIRILPCTVTQIFTYESVNREVDAKTKSEYKKKVASIGKMPFSVMNLNTLFFVEHFCRIMDFGKGPLLHFP